MHDTCYDKQTSNKQMQTHSWAMPQCTKVRNWAIQTEPTNKCCDKDVFPLWIRHAYSQRLQLFPFFYFLLWVPPTVQKNAFLGRLETEFPLGGVWEWILWCHAMGWRPLRSSMMMDGWIDESIWQLLVGQPLNVICRCSLCHLCVTHSTAVMFYTTFPSLCLCRRRWCLSAAVMPDASWLSQIKEHAKCITSCLWQRIFFLLFFLLNPGRSKHSSCVLKSKWKQLHMDSWTTSADSSRQTVWLVGRGGDVRYCPLCRTACAAPSSVQQTPEAPGRPLAHSRAPLCQFAVSWCRCCPDRWLLRRLHSQQQTSNVWMHTMKEQRFLKRKNRLCPFPLERVSIPVRSPCEHPGI